MGDGKISKVGRGEANGECGRGRGRTYASRCWFSGKGDSEAGEGNDGDDG